MPRDTGRDTDRSSKLEPHIKVVKSKENRRLRVTVTPVGRHVRSRTWTAARHIQRAPTLGLALGLGPLRVRLRLARPGPGAFVIILVCISPYLTYPQYPAYPVAISAHAHITSTVQTYEQQCITANVAKSVILIGRHVKGAPQI